jgi:hypothetical protein
MKTIRKILIIVVLFVCQANLLMAQKNKTPSSFRDLIDVNEKVFRSDGFYNKSIFFSINIEVNKLGLVDTVIYSGDNDEDINRMFDLKKITAGLKANRTEFKTYKNEFLVLMVVVIRGEHDLLRIENGNQNLAYWLSIANKSDDAIKRGKRQVLLSPIIIYSRGKAINN